MPIIIEEPEIAIYSGIARFLINKIYHNPNKINPIAPTSSRFQEKIRTSIKINEKREKLFPKISIENMIMHKINRIERILGA